jgi:hypothetical protein
VTQLTKRECEKLALAAVRKYQRTLGLDHLSIDHRFGRSDQEKGLDGADACVMGDYLHETATVLFDARLKPEWYDHEAAHEVLHVRFQTVQRAIEELLEPAKTLLDDALHIAIDRTARALSGKTITPATEKCADAPPWEAKQ